MRIGFDIDGVLANFNQGSTKLINQLNPEQRLMPSDWKTDSPPTWFYHQHFGYTDAQVADMWKHIDASLTFWLNLPPIDENVKALTLMWRHLQRQHSIYFITARKGETSKRQTETWLMDHLVLPARSRFLNAEGLERARLDTVRHPTVLISHEKGMCAKALDLDVYIDDHLENTVDCAHRSPNTRTYLLNRPYNEHAILPGATVTRVNTLGEMLDYEIENL